MEHFHGWRASFISRLVEWSHVLEEQDEEQLGISSASWWGGDRVLMGCGQSNGACRKRSREWRGNPSPCRHT